MEASSSATAVKRAPLIWQGRNRDTAEQRVKVVEVITQGSARSLKGFSPRETGENVYLLVSFSRYK